MHELEEVKPTIEKLRDILGRMPREVRDYYVQYLQVTLGITPQREAPVHVDVARATPPTPQVAVAGKSLRVRDLLHLMHEVWGASNETVNAMVLAQRINTRGFQLTEPQIQNIRMILGQGMRANRYIRVRRGYYKQNENFLGVTMPALPLFEACRMYAPQDMFTTHQMWEILRDKKFVFRKRKPAAQRASVYKSLEQQVKSFDNLGDGRWVRVKVQATA